VALDPSYPKRSFKAVPLFLFHLAVEGEKIAILDEHTRVPSPVRGAEWEFQMTTANPQLITFAASHFCEKARWALDWHHIRYDEVGWPPGLHQILAKRSGAKHTTVPILFDGDDVIQGSGAIIDWTDMKDKDKRRRLTPAQDNRTEAMEIERRADRIIGIHVRRLAFAELLPDYSHMVKPALFYRASGWRRLIGNMMWPVSWRVIMRMYEIRPGAAAESRATLEAEFDWLEEKLADGRIYLTGDRFSRADLTVASLLANFAKPNELPDAHGMSGPETLGADVARCSKRPMMRWVKTIYETHRTC
jgi:glutathione S-transferase